MYALRLAESSTEGKLINRYYVVTMNLTPHINEKDMDQLRTKQVQKKKNEFHLIGQERRIKGHTLFCFNLVKREIKVAPMNQEIEMGMDGSVIYKNNVTVEKGCVYVQALNEKNARKKLIKMGYRL
jgi:hypothetical protein